MDEILQDIVATFQHAANPTKATAMKAYMKHHFEFFGVTSPVRKELSKPYLRHKLTKREDLNRLVYLLWQQEERELQYVAMDFLDKNRKLLTMDDLPFLEELITSKSWWDTVDNLAAKVVGLLLQRFPDQMEAAVKPWIVSDNLWLNRSAIIFQLKYKDMTNVDLLTQAIRPHSDSPEFFHQKAIGWALRQYSKHNPEWVRHYLAQHDLRPLSIREAEKYL